MAVLTWPQGSTRRRDKDKLTPSSQANIGASMVLVGPTRRVFRWSCRVVISSRDIFSWSCGVVSWSSGVFSWSCGVVSWSRRMWRLLRRVTSSMASVNSCVGSWFVSKASEACPSRFFLSFWKTRIAIITTLNSRISPSVVHSIGCGEDYTGSIIALTVRDEIRMFSTLSRSVQWGLFRCRTTDSCETIVDKLKG